MWAADARAPHQIQNSPEWHAFRRNHVGASDIPALMGTCDFRTEADVFKAKMDGEVWEGNWATQRGKNLEPVALALFEQKHACKLTQPTLEYPAWRILSASLDGLWAERPAVVEFKAPAVWKQTMALCGLLPETYEDQVQAQLLVAQVDHAFYVSYHPDLPEGFQYAEVLVEANSRRQFEILDCAQRFWEKVEKARYEREKAL